MPVSYKTLNETSIVENINLCPQNKQFEAMLNLDYQIITVSHCSHLVNMNPK